MKPEQIAQVISQEVDKRFGNYVDNQYLRAVVESVVDDNHVDLYIEGARNVTESVLCLQYYTPEVGDKVLVLNMGRSGANLLVVGSLVVKDVWHEIGDTGEPAFTNSWVNYGIPTHGAAKFMKDTNGFVHLSGLIKSGTVGSSAFTLPAGYRPSGTHPNPKLIFGVISNALIGRVDIFPDGTVVPITPSSNAWVTLDGITFLAEN